MSVLLGIRTPLTMPLIPVILPFVQSISVAASPIRSPPMAALTGVKYSNGSPYESEVNEILVITVLHFTLSPTLYGDRIILDQGSAPFDLTMNQAYSSFPNSTAVKRRHENT